MARLLVSKIKQFAFPLDEVIFMSLWSHCR